MALKISDFAPLLHFLGRTKPPTLPLYNISWYLTLLRCARSVADQQNRPDLDIVHWERMIVFGKVAMKSESKEAYRATCDVISTRVKVDSASGKAALS